MTWRYHRGVVRQRHFGMVHTQKAFFSNYEGEIVGLVQRKKWYNPWQVHTVSYDVDTSPGLVVPGMHSAAALVLATLSSETSGVLSHFLILCVLLCRHSRASFNANDFLQGQRQYADRAKRVFSMCGTGCVYRLRSRMWSHRRTRYTTATYASSEGGDLVISCALKEAGHGLSLIHI